MVPRWRHGQSRHLRMKQPYTDLHLGSEEVVKANLSAHRSSCDILEVANVEHAYHIIFSDPTKFTS